MGRLGEQTSSNLRRAIAGGNTSKIRLASHDICGVFLYFVEFPDDLKSIHRVAMHTADYTELLSTIDGLSAQARGFGEISLTKLSLGGC